MSDSDNKIGLEDDTARQRDDENTPPNHPRSTKSKGGDVHSEEEASPHPEGVEPKIRGGRLLKPSSTDTVSTDGDTSILDAPDTGTPDPGTPGTGALGTAGPTTFNPSKGPNSQEEVQRSELAKNTYRALWAREIKESLSSGDPQRVLKTLISITPGEVSNVSAQYQKLYGNPLLQLLEQTLGTAHPNEFNQALFILEGRPIFAQALAVDHALTSSHNRIKSLQLALERNTLSEDLLKAYSELTGTHLHAVVESSLPEGDKQIVQAMLADQPARATALWLLKELSSPCIDTTTLEEICISGGLPDPEERYQQFHTHTGMTLDSILSAMPNGLVKDEVGAILRNQFTDAHAIRVGRLLRQPSPQVHPSKVHEQITQLLLLYALREKNFLFRRYRERYQTSLHDDVMQFMEDLKGRQTQVTDDGAKQDPSKVEAIANALLNSIDVDNALRLLRNCDQTSIHEIDARVRKQRNISLRDLINTYLHDADPSELESTLQGLPGSLESATPSENATHSSLNVLSSKLMDTYSTHGSLLDKSIENANQQFPGTARERDQLERQDEADFLALVDIVDADIEAYRKPRPSLAVAGAKSSSFAAAILCFIFVEVLDYYIDNISPSIFVSIFVAVMMGLVAESIIQPYLHHRLVNAEKLVEKVHQKRSSIGDNRPVGDQPKGQTEEIGPTGSS